MSSQRRTGGQRLATLAAAEPRQPRPVHTRSRVMLDVIAVVEEAQVVEPAVVTGRAARVLEVTLQRDRGQAPRGTRADRPMRRTPLSTNTIATHNATSTNPASTRIARVHRIAGLSRPLWCRRWRSRRTAVGMARSSVNKIGYRPVQNRRPEERQMNEVVRDRVRVPPEPQRDQRGWKERRASRIAWASDKATSTASAFECRNTPVDAGMAATGLAPGL